jgi:hypothetical protein
MIKIDRVRLLFPPYTPPAVNIGDTLYDKITGKTKVGGWSNGRISWPRRKKTGAHSLILCGDLVRAVKSESALAIEYWFGVGATTVAKWRKALGVDRQNNAGTVKLYQDYKPLKITDDVAEKGRQKAKLPESIAKMAATKTGKPAHENTKAALLRNAKASKPEGWGDKANKWMLKGGSKTQKI